MAKKRRLKSSIDLRRYLADLINRLEADEVSSEKAGKIGYLVNILRAVIEISDIEQRLEQLEREFKKQTR